MHCNKCFEHVEALHPAGTMPRLGLLGLRQYRDEMRLHFLAALHGGGIKGPLNSDPRRLTIKGHQCNPGGNRNSNYQGDGIEQPEPESVLYDPHSPGVGCRDRKAISPCVQLWMVLPQAEEKIASIRIDVLNARPLSAMEGEILPVRDIRADLDLGTRPDRLPLLGHGRNPRSRAF
jgi:hypothetical protein